VLVMVHVTEFHRVTPETAELLYQGISGKFVFIEV